MMTEVSVGGWLVNEQRRERRDQPRTLTDNDVEALIDKICNPQLYKTQTR